MLSFAFYHVLMPKIFRESLIYHSNYIKIYIIGGKELKDLRVDRSTNEEIFSSVSNDYCQNNLNVIKYYQVMRRSCSVYASMYRVRH